MTFSEYIEQLASEHKDIRHSAEECHYSDLTEDAQNSYSHTRMHYPCVVLDEGSTSYTGSPSQPYRVDFYTLIFADHVRDTGNASEIRDTFTRMKRVADDFLKRMVRDRRKVKLMSRFDIVDSEMQRVYLQDAALYGYAVYLKNTTTFIDNDCNNAFEEE